MSSIREVSRIAGVSIATVSRTLSHPEKVSKKTRDIVMKAIKEVDYRPNMLARNFRSVRAYSIVVLVPHLANLFFSTVIRGIEDAAQSRNYSVLLGDTRDSDQRENDYIDLVKTKRADGLIQLKPYRQNSSLEAYKDVPIVSTCGCENTPYYNIRVDNAGAAKTAVDHFISQGHTRIAVITGKQDNPHSIDRLKGYKASLTAANIPIDESLIIEGSFTLDSGVEAAHALCQLSAKPTAVFSMNDEMAIGAIKGFRQAGLNVPHDVSIAGFDDIEYSRFIDPALTTIAQPAEALGHRAFDLLYQLIEGEHPEEKDIVLPYDFVVRDSTPDLGIR